MQRFIKKWWYRLLGREYVVVEAKVWNSSYLEIDPAIILKVKRSLIEVWWPPEKDDTVT